jgi:hypothetical protein
MAFANTACTGHFLLPNSHCDHIHPTEHGIRVLLPNKDTIQATHTCQLRLPHLPSTATIGHIFTHLAHPLVSIPVLCDHGCDATFTKTSVTIKHGNTIILNGPRDPSTGMWQVPLQPDSTQPSLSTAGPHQANSAYHTSTKPEHVQFLHAAAGYPVPSTWTKAINAGNYNTWPGLDAKLVTKHLPKSKETVKGHLNQQRKNLRSTKIPPSPIKPTNLRSTQIPPSPIK